MNQEKNIKIVKFICQVLFVAGALWFVYYIAGI